VALTGLLSCSVLLPTSVRAEGESEQAVEEVAESPPTVPNPPSVPVGNKAASVAAPPKLLGVSNSRALYRSLIEREVRNTNLPADVAEAVMGVESGYEPSRIGADGEIGLMQVMPPTARMLGFIGSMAEFAAPEVNIRYGVMYLAQAWNRAGGDLCTALMKYRAGHGETRFSHLSVTYCLRARARLMAVGYPVTGTVPVATFGSPGGSSLVASCRGSRCLMSRNAGRVDFAALNNRLTQVVMQTNGPKPMTR
jgi:hypothetical protein